MAETAKILAPDKTVLIPDAARGVLAGRLDHRRPAARVEGRAPGRGRGVLREHDRRGEGRDRHLLHVVERGRGGRVDPGRPRGAVPARPVPRRARPTGDRPGEPARLGGGVPRPRGHQRRRRSPPRSTRHPDAELYVHPECGCATSALYLAGTGAVPPERVRILSTGGMLDAARDARRRARCWSPPRSACCTSCAARPPTSTFRAVNDRASCRYMKMITPEKLLRCAARGSRRGARRPGTGRPRPPRRRSG